MTKINMQQHISFVLKKQRTKDYLLSHKQVKSAHNFSEQDNMDADDIWVVNGKKCCLTYD
jgi:hypothetical protein